MADVTPTTAIDNSKVALTWGSNTYHGVARWNRSGRADSTSIKFSTSTGIGTIRIGGGVEAAFTIDIYVDEGDATTPAAFKEGTEETTCELHPEGDTTGNIELIFDDGGIVESMEMGGNPGDAMMISITIGSIGSSTIQDAV
jgi:hypothetical protein